MAKEVIRENCFESNSSSQHVLVVTKNNSHVTAEELSYEKYDPDNYEQMYLDKKGKYWYHDIYQGFGRGPFEILTTFKDKVKYALCEYCGFYYPDPEEFDKNYNMIRDIVREVLPGFIDFDIRTEEYDIYLDKNGNELKHSELNYAGYDEETKKDYYLYKDKETGKMLTAVLDEENVYELPHIGVIDHQSMGLLRGFLKKKGIDLKEFLTNKKYMVVITSDETDDWPRMKASKIIDVDFIEEEYS